MTDKADTERITVAIVDDHELLRDGIAQLLGMSSRLEVALLASNGEEALTALAATPVDVVVMDIRMPGDSGIEILKRLRASGDTTPVLILTTFDEPQLLLESTAAGAQGFMLKDTSPHQLIAAIESLSEGGVVLEPISLPHHEPRYGYSATPKVDDLTARELEILRLMAGGYTNRDIASALHLAEGTVKNYVSDILAKLDVTDRTKAVLRAITNHLV